MISFYDYNNGDLAQIQNADIVVLGVPASGELCALGQSLDKACQGSLVRAIQDQMKSALPSKEENACMTSPIMFYAPKDLGSVGRIMVHPMPKELSEKACQKMGGEIAKSVSAVRKNNVAICFGDYLSDAQVAHVAFGFGVRSWSFDTYLTDASKERKLFVPNAVSFAAHHKKEAEEAFRPLKHIMEGINSARTYTSEPGNVLYPESFAERVSALKEHGVHVEIMTGSELREKGFHAMMGVAQGSEKDARLVVLNWQGANENEPPVAVVGKGVTFDTGGISIKPSRKMEDMKYDMTGAAIVAGVLEAVAKNKVPVNVVGVMGLVENMPSGSAQRPGDIVTSLSGQTIEVINTDAEGRLVLADALWYTQDRFKPKYMVDLATLTGAVTIALGPVYAAVFSNDDTLRKDLMEASDKTGEKIWELPLCDVFHKALKAHQADLKNSDYGVGAGSSTAAQFLKCFVNDTPWAHLDIAGVSWSEKPSALTEKGATGFGVKLLCEWIDRMA